MLVGKNSTSSLEHRARCSLSGGQHTVSESGLAYVRIVPIFNGSCRIAVEQGEFEMPWMALLDGGDKKIAPVAWADLDEQAMTALTNHSQPRRRR
jgi:hypothetical protein